MRCQCGCSTNKHVNFNGEVIDPEFESMAFCDDCDCTRYIPMIPLIDEDLFHGEDNDE